MVLDTFDDRLWAAGLSAAPSAGRTVLGETLTPHEPRRSPANGDRGFRAAASAVELPAGPGRDTLGEVLGGRAGDRSVPR